MGEMDGILRDGKQDDDRRRLGRRK